MTKKKSEKKSLSNKQKKKQDKHRGLSYKLTNKQKKFIEEYIVNLNATEAAKRAGYKKDNAHVIGFENLIKLKHHIEPKLREQLEHAQITAQRLLQEESLIAFSDIKNVFKPGWELMDIDDLPPEITRTIKSVKIRYDKNDNKVIDITLNSKGKALDRLGKYFDLYNKLVIEGGDKPILVEDRDKMIDDYMKKFPKKEEKIKIKED